MTVAASLEQKSLAIQNLETRISKDKLRLAVATTDDKLYSGIWAAWGNKSDFYIGALTTLGSMKVSLHASGICRVAFTEPAMRRLKDEGLETPSDRAIVKWRRPATPTEGAALVASLIFPTAFLKQPPREGSARRPLVVVNAGPRAEAVEVGFFYSRMPNAHLEPSLSKIGHPLFWAQLDSGETVSIVARNRDFDPKSLPSSEQMNRSKMNPLRSHIEDELENLTAAFWNEPKDGGALQVMEISGVRMRKNTPAAA